MTDIPKRSHPLRIAVLISGGGTTLLNLQDKIDQQALSATIPLVIASRQCTGIKRCKAKGLSPVLISPKDYASVETFSEEIFSQVRAVDAELVVLAGFLSMIKIPDDYFGKVMNIHPSLIPAFCGKGMYGDRVHEAVIARGCKVSGCTVHFCDNEYDHGPIILQETVPVTADDHAESLAARVNKAESSVYPKAIQLFADGRLQIVDRRVHILDD